MAGAKSPSAGAFAGRFEDGNMESDKMRAPAIRIAKPDDEPAVGVLLEASYPELMRRGYDAAVLAAALPVMTRANPVLLASGTYYLAETASRCIVGCGGWTRERPGSGEVEDGVGHVRHFATHPDWIGRGVGRGIYEVCEREARVAGINRFECYASLNAEGFYAALGFRTTRRIDLALTSDHVLPCVAMERSLPPCCRR
jgi:GNAT superfamily N-acetyltransferase